jgi:hypothetical protein
MIKVILVIVVLIIYAFFEFLIISLTDNIDIIISNKVLGFIIVFISAAIMFIILILIQKRFGILSN